jgi:TonB family protein
MSHVLQKAVVEIPKPEYPNAAAAVNASGQVTVRVLVDLKGKVVRACALDGHPLLRKAALDAAKAGKFKPNFGLSSPQMRYGRRYLEDEITFTFVGKVRT